MELTNKRQVSDWLRRPKKALFLVLGIMVLLNVVYLGFSTLPAFLESRKVQLELDGKLTERDQLENQPTPATVTNAEIWGLLAKVPVVLDQAGMIATLLKFVAESDVQLSLYKQEGLGITAASGAEQSSLQSTPQEAGNESASGQTNTGVFKETPVQLNVTGKLPGLLLFFDKIAASEQIIKINHWSFNQHSESGAGSTNPQELSVSSGGYSLQMQLTYYSIPGLSTLESVVAP